MNTGFERIRDIFLAIVEQPSGQGETLLDEACGNDLELRRQVVVLLQAHAKEEGILDINQPGRALHGVNESAIEGPGPLMGPYKLLEQIGEGGMGTVFMAEQIHPVRRTVALKVIKAGMDTRQVIARFEAERQALAMMEHLNIARVLDVGATDTGRPFFVMELVHGVPINKYCDDNQLTPRERLELFVPVCRAIQHAHQKGIIHRDVKPSNILVTLSDGMPVPKVIDFGVAKATEQPLIERSQFTQLGTMVGTLEYMSPEQAEMSAQGVDTRSDIYSLGVLLYELLTGSTPLSQLRIREAAYGEILRMIKEEEPPKPSSRLGGSGTALASIAAQRHMDSGKLTKLMRGELDWIVMKCLEKDRNRRYETANGLARDIERYLHGEPVYAYPPTANYRLRKFAGRHKAGVVIAGLILIFIVMLGSGAGWLVRDRAERLRAVEREINEAHQWQEQEKWPEALAAIHRAERLLADGGGNSVVQERVHDARRDFDMVLRLEGIMHELTAQEGNPLKFDFAKRDTEYAAAFREYGIDVEVLEPVEVADLIAGRNIRLQLALALDAWAEARRFVRPLRSKSWKDLLTVACVADPDLWRVRVREALRNRNRAALLEAADQIPIGSVPPITLGLLARALKDAGAPKQAVALFRRAQRRHPNSFWLNFDLASALMSQKPAEMEEAIRYLSVALALRPASWPARGGLSDALQRQGKLDEAVAELRESIALNSNDPAPWINRGKAFHKLHHYEDAIADFSQALSIDAHNVLAWTYRGNGYHELHQYEKAIADRSKALSLDPKYSMGWTYRGNSYHDFHQYDKAVADHSKAVELDPTNAISWSCRGLAYHELHQYENAIADYSKALALEPKNAVVWTYRGNSYHDLHQYDKAIADDSKAIELDPRSSWLWSCRAFAYNSSRQYGKAIADYSKTIEIDPNNRTALNGLAWLLATCPDTSYRNPARAVERAQRAVELEPNNGNQWNTLGVARYRAGVLKAAIVALEKSMELRKGGDSLDWFFLAMAHWQLGDKEQARKWYEQALQWMQKNQPENEELLRFGVEAAELLMIADNAKPK
jgi:eukaryotic-like serine/threonine-protein kinase